MLYSFRIWPVSCSCLCQLGLHSLQVNSVQFSNHTGYPTKRGAALDGPGLWELVEGLQENGLLNYTHLLTGTGHWLAPVAPSTLMHRVVCIWGLSGVRLPSPVPKSGKGSAVKGFACGSILPHASWPCLLRSLHSASRWQPCPSLLLCSTPCMGVLAAGSAEALAAVPFFGNLQRSAFCCWRYSNS